MPSIMPIVSQSLSEYRRLKSEPIDRLEIDSELYFYMAYIRMRHITVLMQITILMDSEVLTVNQLICMSIYPSRCWKRT